jgi:pyridoxal phosphate enzyme (YggS family)
MIKQNLIFINEKIANTCKSFKKNYQDVNIIAVSKTIASDKIIEAINCGCKIFGENYIQEACQKFPEIKKQFPAISLHLMGHLQSNKVSEAINLFDCIHTLDSEKLAKLLKKECLKQNKNIEIFIQVNIGQEEQKFGIDLNDIDNFVKFCKNDLSLNIVGLMAIPPADEYASPYFALLKKINDRNNLKKISMGMSSDFDQAIALGATHIRIGTALFGERNKNCN